MHSVGEDEPDWAKEGARRWVSPDSRRGIGLVEDSKYVGDYDVWKTGISDEFSTLTADEVCVLFCFLCSDSGPPDLTDTEWLDLLNEIRQLVNHEFNLVTREEAQQTLDRLKSRDFLWEDRDKITKDTKDETMYRITSIHSFIPFYYSSYDTASVYLRSQRYNRKPGEKCGISSFSYCDSLLILRLQMNILTHVTMEDTSIYDKIYQILNIPYNILNEDEDKRKQLLMDLRRGGEAVHYRGRSHDSVDHVTWLWRYGIEARPDIVVSCIGLHPHNDIYIIDNRPYRKPSELLNNPPDVRCLLYSLLLTEKYQLNLSEQSHRVIRDKIRDRYFPDVTDDGLVHFPEGFTETHNGMITFISDDIRHDVMYAFVTECLVEDSDLEFFLTTASRDVISEYCRSWDYERSEGERCLYVPDRPEMYDLFIDKLQLDIISHFTVSDDGIHNSICKRLEVPEEILRWDQEARERYVEYAKRGTKTVHHARGMIVGCAGAGKTTLLKRLLGCSKKVIKEIKSTEGLEVHEEIFDIDDNTKLLKVKSAHKDSKSKENNSTNVETNTLTMFDFGGQCAYYACHQIYLTRRAFYVVVVDASKRLDQKVDKEVCDQNGSVFSGWTYGNYFAFWIRSIHTYCGSDNVNDTKPTVLIVATHWEKSNRQYKDKKELMGSLQLQFPRSSKLSHYISDAEFYCAKFAKPLNELEKRLYKIASEQRWNENIPIEWFNFGIEINQIKISARIMKISEIKKEVPETTAQGQKGEDRVLVGKHDMLRYYHDAGKALYFYEEDLKDEVIIDVQWFVDAFKHIITDELHFKGIPVTQGDWDEYYETGNLRDRLLLEIWKHKDRELSKDLREEEIYDIVGIKLFKKSGKYLQYHKESLLKFMQRLGLMAVGKESHYVPCMNRKEIEKGLIARIKNSESKSSVLVYKFDFLPFFLFFRLVVASMQEDGWDVLENDGLSCLYKNAALFSYMKYNIVLSVSEDSIQLQVFPSMGGYVLERETTCRIQGRIEQMLNNLARTFHRKIKFVRGFRCQMDEVETIPMKIDKHFLPETRILKEERIMGCPLHSVTAPHNIDTSELMQYWELKKDTIL
ncbi:uncharacterized protein LOC134273234 [Saccostrea cucullata]|uniref:uncharacterized protein LOC134273234 n=1 Tax=Saccostrea cuccullata TaxID=36930 RepID=UPI002ECFCE06